MSMFLPKQETIDRFLEDIISESVPPLDSNVYRIGFALVPAAYFFS